MTIDFFASFGPGVLIAAALVAIFAGFIKGATGFGMPTIMISGLGSFLSPEIALAGLAVPTLVSNLWLAVQQGIPAAVASATEDARAMTIRASSSASG